METLARFYSDFSSLLGLKVEPKNLTFLQVSLRGVVVFLFALAMVRMGHKRSLSRKTAFDAALLVILASVLSRGINGSAAFWPTIGGGFVLVFLHRVLATFAYRSHTFGRWIKGSDDVIVRDGKLLREEMRRNQVSENDVAEDLRLSGSDDLAQVHEARIERSGDISFIKKEE